MSQKKQNKKESYRMKATYSRMQFIYCENTQKNIRYCLEIHKYVIKNKAMKNAWSWWTPVRSKIPCSEEGRRNIRELRKVARKRKLQVYLKCFSLQAKKKKKKGLKQIWQNIKMWKTWQVKTQVFYYFGYMRRHSKWKKILGDSCQCLLWARLSILKLHLHLHS